MIVGLTGKARSGKDTTCRYLQAIDPKIQRLAFADKLKDSAAAAFGTDREMLEHLKNDESIVYIPVRNKNDGLLDPWWFDAPQFTIRQYLQRFGTEAHRDIFGDSFWVDSTLPEPGYDRGHIYVVTDTRFPNEIEAIHERDGIIVQIIRPDEKIESSSHPSEQDIDPTTIDLVLQNGKDIDHLRMQTEFLYDEIVLRMRERGEHYVASV